MANVTVVAGREAKLSCVVDNLRDYKVAWVHYGDIGTAVLAVGTHVLTTNRRVTVAAERDTWALVIANATVHDRGEYMCQISTVPPKKMHVTLEVLVPPHINVPPKDVTVNESQNVTLECQATGDPQPKITWRRETDAHSRHDQIPIGENEGSVLSLPSVKRSMAGAFLCMASNGVPPAVSARALLSVNYGPKVIGNESSVRWASVGEEDVRLECLFDSFPEPKVIWEIDDGPKVETRYFSSKRQISSRIHLREVGQRDFGRYRCTAKNSFGQASILHILKERLTPTTTTTTTPPPPPVTAPPLYPVRPAQSSGRMNEAPGSGTSGPEKDVNRGQDNLFDFGIRESKASVKDQLDALSANKTKGDLISRKVETSPPKRFVQESPHGNVYPIEDTNGPKVIGNESSVRWASVGEEDVRLECLFDSFPEPKVIWEIDDGHKVETRYFSSKRQISSRIHLREVGQRDFGRYRCTAKNSFGQASILHILKERLTPTTTTTTTPPPPPVTAPPFYPVRPAQSSGRMNEAPGSGTSGPEKDANKGQENLFDFGIRESKASVKDQLDALSANKTKGDLISRKVETSPPKRFVQESPHGNVYPIEDTSLLSSSTFSCAVGHHQRNLLWRIGGALFTVTLVAPLVESLHGPITKRIQYIWSVHG